MDRQQAPMSTDTGPSKVLIITLIVATLLVLSMVLLFVRLILWRRRVIRAPPLTPEQMQAALAHNDALHIDRERVSFANLPQQAPSVVRMQRLLQNSGLSIDELNSVAPTTPYVTKGTSPLRALQDADNDDTCAVCLDQMDADAKTRRMPCQHVFHAKCIEDWVTKVNRCPVCNTCIIDEETLQKNRTALLEGRDPTAAAAAAPTRQRRRRTRGQNGAFELRESANDQSDIPVPEATQ